jgi:hypothetical protein
MINSRNITDLKTIKSLAETFNALDDIKRVTSDGLNLSKNEDEEILSDGYTFLRAVRMSFTNERGFKSFANSLCIKKLVKTNADCIQTLLGLSKAKVLRNDVFIAIEIKNDEPQVVIIWKHS